jgi:putative ABC transport system permease protein
MLENYLRVSVRNMLRHRLFSVINILGLTLGITCSILIILFVSFEKSYDKYDIKADRIYRIAVSAMVGNTKINQIYSSVIGRRTLHDKKTPRSRLVGCRGIFI